LEYKCSSCGKIHEEWPALTYNSPSYYHDLSEDEKSTIGNLDPDFCKINYPGEQLRFIRCTLTQKVNDHCEDLEYGLWVSLSEKSFNDYSENYNNNDHEAGYFGWLSSRIPEYDFEKSIPTNVVTRTGGYRPEIIPHEDFDHPFVTDYYSGITKAEAERRINKMLKG
jgi:hypothetical protein